MDLGISCYICSKLNAKYEGLNLYNILIYFTKDEEKKKEITGAFAESLIKIYKQIKNFDFSFEKFQEYKKKIVNNLFYEENTDWLRELEIDICIFLFENKKKYFDYIETLLICMLGHRDMVICDHAIILLNILYDKVDWQLRGEHNPKINCIGLFLFQANKI